MNTKHLSERLNLVHSEIIEAIPAACADELTAVEFLEKHRWGDTPCCPHCGSVGVYKMLAKGGGRSKRFLWRCRDCKQQYTVRIGTVYEESRVPLRHWTFAFWAMASSKKGVSALQIKRQTGISYKSALFLLHRIRFAMAADHRTAPKLSGTVECDETYVGGKPRRGTGPHKHGRGTSKTPVFGMVERGGNIRRRVIANVSGSTLKRHMKQCIDKSSRIVTDEAKFYPVVARTFGGGHETVRHSKKEFTRGDVHTNTIESSFAILKRGLIGTFHAVSKEHLHRYVDEFDFKWNTRQINDGDRLSLVVKQSAGKRLTYDELRG